MRSKKRQPEYLKKGDEVAIISPSFFIDGGKITEAARFLEQWGLKVRIGRNAMKQDGPFAGTCEERLEDLQEVTRDPSIKAVFCSRGGYGLSRIIDMADFSALDENPKWYVGFSDITVLHMWLSEVCGIMSVHGDMPLNFGNSAKTGMTFTSLRDALFGKLMNVQWEGPFFRPGKAKGEVTGGNLSLLYSLTGTPAEPSTDGKILFIEDTGEYYYHIDRMLTSLKLAGKLDNLAALVVGGMSEVMESKVPWGKTIEDTILEITKGKGYPVLFNFPAGHVSDNRAFYIGREAVVEAAGDSARLTFA